MLAGLRIYLVAAATFWLAACAASPSVEPTGPSGAVVDAGGVDSSSDATTPDAGQLDVIELDTVGSDLAPDVALGELPLDGVAEDAAAEDAMADGEADPADAVADAGEGCNPGAPCTPGDACQSGLTSCAGGQATCTATGPAAVGTACGTDQVCNAAGVCIPCKTGAGCAPATPCHAGATACWTGEPVCIDSGTNAPDGTTCGDGNVCQAGSCVPATCTAGMACTPENPCHQGATTCPDGPMGAASCLDTAVPIAAGTACGADQVCDTAGICQTCVGGSACTPENPCHTGVSSCSAGPLCADTGNAAAGTPCGMGKVCDAAQQCIACDEGAACVLDGSCQKAEIHCGSGEALCTATAENVADGTACGTNKVCSAGTCVAAPTAITIDKPEALHLGKGASILLSVTATYADGTSVMLAPTAVTWVSSAPTVADVLPSGWIAALGAGTASLTASVGSVSDSFSIQVTAPQFVAWAGTSAFRAAQPTFLAWASAEAFRAAPPSFLSWATAHASHGASPQSWLSWGQNHVTASH